MALTKIGTNSIKDDAVTNAKIADDAIDTPQIADGAVDTINIADLNVDTGKINNDAVTGAKIADDTIGSEHYIAGSVDTTAIADTAVTLAKLEHGTSSNDGKFLRANNGADPTFETVDLANLNASNLTSGTIPDARFPTTLPAISGANLTGISSAGTAQNLIINGAMQIAQRGTSSTSSGLNTIDRWTCNWSGGGVTQAQVSEQSGTVFENGFNNYLRLTNTSNTTTDTDYRFIGQTIEAQNVANSGWNFKSSSSYVTLSFWVRSSLAGTYYGWLNSRDGTAKTHTFSFTLSANTWTKVTKTISGNSGIDIHNNNEEGLVVHIIPWYGTYYSTSGHTLNAWQTSDSTNRCPDYSQNWANTSNATFDLTGVQLEVGQTATDFAHESYAETLAKCQRYFQVLVDSEGVYFGGGYMYDHYRAYLPVQYYVEMRAAPSFQYTSGTNYWSLHRAGTGDNFDGWNTTIGGDNRHVAIQAQSGLSGTGGDAGAFWSGNANSKITFSAEI